MLSGCDITSYLYDITRQSYSHQDFLKLYFLGLNDVIGDIYVNQSILLESGCHFIAAMYEIPVNTSMEEACCTLFTKNRRPPKVMAWPPTSLKIMRAHLQVKLWKAADHNSSPKEAYDIIKFGWQLKDGLLIPVIAGVDIAPT